MQNREPQGAEDVAKASLVILSERFSSTDLSDAIGLVPDRQWEKGALRPGNRPGVYYRFSGVEFSSQLPSASRWPDHLADLLVRLTPAKDRIGHLIAALTASPDPFDTMPACVWISHTTPSATPHYIFSPEQLAFIAEIGASLGVSVYSDYRDPDEPTV